LGKEKKRGKSLGKRTGKSLHCSQRVIDLFDVKKGGRFYRRDSSSGKKGQEGGDLCVPDCVRKMEGGGGKAGIIPKADGQEGVDLHTFWV